MATSKELLEIRGKGHRLHIPRWRTFWIACKIAVLGANISHTTPSVLFSRKILSVMVLSDNACHLQSRWHRFKPSTYKPVCEKCVSISMQCSMTLDRNWLSRHHRCSSISSVIRHFFVGSRWFQCSHASVVKGSSQQVQIHSVGWGFSEANSVDLFAVCSVVVLGGLKFVDCV